MPRSAKPAPEAPPRHPFDIEYGVDTSGLIPAGKLLTGHPSDSHVTAYYGVAPSILNGMIDRWLETAPPHPIDRYVFIDIGAGKGRAMLLASLIPFRQVIGIELNPGLADIAQANLDHWNATAAPLAPIRLLEQDVLSFDLPRSPCVLFLFHPFEAPVLRKLLRRIETRLTSGAKGLPALDILYVNAECASVLDHHPAFARLFFGSIAMSAADHAADRAAIATQKDYGSTGDEECAIYRYLGRTSSPG